MLFNITCVCLRPLLLLCWRERIHRENLGQRGKRGFYRTAVLACGGVCICAQVYTNMPSSAQLCVTDLVLLNSGSKSSVPVPAAIWCGWLRVTALLLHLVSRHEAQWSLDWTFPFHFAQFIWFYTNVNRGCDKTGDKMDWAQSTC